MEDPFCQGGFRAGSETAVLLFFGKLYDSKTPEPEKYAFGDGALAPIVKL